MSNNSVKKPEEMREFFNIRAEGYDDHMKENVTSFYELYKKVSDPIKATEEDIKILDLGCGTGLELESIFYKAPRAKITGIDLSKEMLGLLIDKYSKYSDQINLIEASYLTYPLKQYAYHYAVSVMTMHHWLWDDKVSLYSKIRDSLKNGGKYIEGDYVVSEEEEKECLAEYRERIKLVKEDNHYHLDIPFSEKNQISVLKEAGFSNVEIIHSVEGNRIFVATK